MIEDNFNIDEILLGSIEERVKAYNYPVTVMVNGKLIFHKGQPIKVRVSRDSEGSTSLDIGYYARRDLTNVFEVSSIAENAVLDKLKKTSIVGIDLGFTRNQINLTYEFNSNLRTLNIVQNIFKDVVEVAYTHYNPSDSYAINGITINSEIKAKLFDRLEAYFMDNYSEILNRKLVRLIRNSKIQDARFHYMFDVFCPIFITGPCITNPLLDCDRRKKFLEDTKILEFARNDIVQMVDLKVYFVTLKELAQAFNLSETIRLTADQATSIFFGYFNSDGYPSKNRFLHIEMNDDGSQTPVYEEEFSKLSREDIELRNIYTVDSFRNYCRQIAITNGYSKKKDLVKIMEGFQLV